MCVGGGGAEGGVGVRTTGQILTIASTSLLYFAGGRHTPLESGALPICVLVCLHVCSRARVCVCVCVHVCAGVWGCLRFLSLAAPSPSILSLN
jgi:hypothetical protein